MNRDNINNNNHHNNNNDDSNSSPPHLEVVPKGPGPQHLEEGVVVDVFAHIVQVIVFASCTDTLLCVGGAGQPGHGVRRVDGVQEDGLELR